MSAAVEAYIEEREGRQQQIFRLLHDWLITYPEVTAKIRYRIPFYFRNTWVCYLNPKGLEAVELVFIRGKELSNEQGLLEDHGRKMVSGYFCTDPSSIPFDLLEEILMEAFYLDEGK